MRQTFEEAVSNFTSPQDQQLAEQKKAFAPTLAELRDQERAYPKQQAAWLSRVEVASHRRQLALGKGVKHARLTQLLGDLHGGPGNPGLFQGTANMLRSYIERIERFSLQELSQPLSWRSWYTGPERIRDNFHGIEERIQEMENIVKDGGELHRMLDEKGVQPASVTVPA